jgi:flagellar protein FliS
MIALFDTLVGDFGRAAAAIRKNDIETRCKELNHAALVVGHLENWLDLENGGEPARSLARFYAYLRAKMLEAGARKSAELLESQIQLIVQVRSAWQQLDVAPSQEPEESESASGHPMNGAYSQVPDAMGERIPFSQSA